MDEFYEQLVPSVIYKWTILNNHVDASNEQEIKFSNNQLNATIDFHQNNILELSINDNDTDEKIYYLHFEMKNIKNTVNHIQTFLSYFKNPHKEEQQLINDSRDMNILLSCSAGITTSYFASLMNDALMKLKHNIHVDAINYMELDKVIDQYDVVLLAPQIAYQYNELKKKYGNKVMIIDDTDFATYDVKSVLNKVLDNYALKA
ncbi:MAG: hypothetical protein LUG12_12385 [Erysipelotrichaceae bacterium]|nr:hypothetical protein [Erysipelotrichaceae bacterium]